MSGLGHKSIFCGIFDQINDWSRFEMGVVYLLCWGLVSVQWVALLASLTDLADAVGASVTTASYAFYFKGLGQNAKKSHKLPKRGHL